MDKNKIKTRKGSGFLRQLSATARTTAGSTHSHFKNLTTFLVNFIPLDKIDASELQVRVHFDEDEVKALSNSIKEHGVLQPILVVQNGERYKVIAGERRVRASRMAGMERIPARVITSDDRGEHEIALRENLDRVDLHPLEEGEGYLSLLEAKAYSSHEAIAKAFLKPKSRITECIGFTRLPDETKQALMHSGMKQRSVLRKLLNTNPVEHMALIKKVHDQEQNGELVLPAETAKADEAPKTKVPPAKKEPKPFEVKIETKGLAVPGFRWKVGEGRERLEHYIATIKKMVEDVEKRWPSS